MTTPKDVTRKDSGTVATAEERFRVPAVDIYETSDTVVLVADMPGVGEDGVSVSVEQDNLIIVGRLPSAAPENATEVYSELDLLPYRRVFTLSSDLNAQGVEGKIAHGVLRLTIPKAEEAKVRKIPIKAG